MLVNPAALIAAASLSASVLAPSVISVIVLDDLVRLPAVVSSKVNE